MIRRIFVADTVPTFVLVLLAMALLIALAFLAQKVISG
jgi:hypothetical protein